MSGARRVAIVVVIIVVAAVVGLVLVVLAGGDAIIALLVLGLVLLAAGARISSWQLGARRGASAARRQYVASPSVDVRNEGPHLL
jgi:hypothetical protein